MIIRHYLSFSVIIYHYIYKYIIIYLSLSAIIYLSLSIIIYHDVSIYLSIYLSISLSSLSLYHLYLSISLSVCPSVRPSIRPSVRLYIYLCACTAYQICDLKLLKCVGTNPRLLISAAMGITSTWLPDELSQAWVS